MSTYNIITSTEESTVIAEYTAIEKNQTEYQSEADLERDFIKRLTNQGYQYVDIKNEDELILNLRAQLEKLNDFTFSESEWKQFFENILANKNCGIVEKTETIQSDTVQLLRCDNGNTKNIRLIDKKCIHNNTLQVINQYEEDRGTYKNRYDVTILVNGLPLVHTELKRRGVALREAFNQIKRYQRESFWAACGLFEYVQIFVISNGTHTKYYSNTTRNAHTREQDESKKAHKKKTSNSFEFTSYWADGQNKRINDLEDFTATFFAKHTLLNVLTRYCVFDSEKKLLVMRPYQIAATEKILERIKCSTNYKRAGKLDGGGYIWHTTGSGKTLTSFKTSILATELDTVDKVLFVVDRKDLDYQTKKEYDRFQKGAANGNASTRILQKQLEDEGAKIIITTIQKLDRFISKNQTHDIYAKHVVIIFDECHRSQFGDMHTKITKAFKNYHIFGFTGTPIFTANSPSNGNPKMRTTEQAFGDELHTYTMVDAINDKNVLPFRIDYINTIRQGDKIEDKEVYGIDTEKIIENPQRVTQVVEYILTHFDQKTSRNTHYSLDDKRLKGFNSIFAVSSIGMAKKYYEEFRRLQEDKPNNEKLKVATIFSYNPNEDDPEDVSLPDENLEDNNGLDTPSREFLDAAIADYNAHFKESFDTSAESFQNYYMDVSKKMKSREIDLLIVVNMFLTGFDATTLNTLWVDKRLRQHGLIQAYSRTNRILNRVKTFGNIVCFRPLEKATDDAIARFGNRDAHGIIIMKTYDEYYSRGYEQEGEHKSSYIELIADLKERFPLGENIEGEEAKKEFIQLYGAILRRKNILSAFDNFCGKEILSEAEFQNYQSVYIDFYQEIRKGNGVDKEDINDDIVFELELIKQVDVNIDYILLLVEKYRKSNCKDKSIRENITNLVNSSIELRSKRELIERFVDQVSISTRVDDDWKNFVAERKEEELAAIIENEGLEERQTRNFIKRSFRDGAIKTTGTDIDGILPKISRFGNGNQRENKKQGVITKLCNFFEKYFGI